MVWMETGGDMYKSHNLQAESLLMFTNISGCIFSVFCGNYRIYWLWMFAMRILLMVLIYPIYKEKQRISAPFCSDSSVFEKSISSCFVDILALFWYNVNVIKR